MLREQMLIQYQDLTPLSISTIRRTIKKKLKFSFIKCSARALQATTTGMLNHKKEAATIVLALLKT
jgi:hypothetical protein